MGSHGKSLVRAMKRGRTDPEAFFAILDPDVEWDPYLPRQTPPEYSGPLRGLGAVREFVHDWWSSWGTYEFVVEEVIDRGDHVVIVLRDRAVGSRSGVEIRRRFTQVWTFRGDRVIRYRNVDTKAEALAVIDRGL